MIPKHFPQEAPCLLAIQKNQRHSMQCLTITRQATRTPKATATQRSQDEEDEEDVEGPLIMVLESSMYTSKNSNHVQHDLRNNIRGRRSYSTLEEETAINIPVREKDERTTNNNIVRRGHSEEAANERFKNKKIITSNISLLIGLLLLYEQSLLIFDISMWKDHTTATVGSLCNKNMKEAKFFTYNTEVIESAINKFSNVKQLPRYHFLYNKNLILLSQPQAGIVPLQGWEIQSLGPNRTCQPQPPSISKLCCLGSTSEGGDVNFKQHICNNTLATHQHVAKYTIRYLNKYRNITKASIKKRIKNKKLILP